MNQERIETLRLLLKQDPDDLFSRFALALEHLETQPEVSESGFRDVLQRDPRYVAAYFQMGKLCLDQDREAEARSWLEQGMSVADQVGDRHAYEEMQDTLDQL